MRLLKWLMGSTAGFMLISCVTINIYFPAAAAEKAADRIIEDVWGREVQTQPKSTSPEDTSELKQTLPIAMQLLNWLVSPAQAEVNLNINSPAINALQAKMKQRHEQLHPFYQTGAIGLTSNGLITLREASAVPLKDRNTVNTLIAEENQDRKALYAEIARANGHPEWESDIQETFARRWISNAAKGWWFQQGGSWQQK
ncbi:MAG: YdbL family protein [Gammaproteobacteria bacterium]|nr:YdbL family protein [Gammaproteobacteria bacterium]